MPIIAACVPLVYFIIYIVIGTRKAGEYTSLIFTILGSLYLAFLYQSGIVGPIVTEWASIFTVNSDIAIHIYLIGLFVVPTSMMLGLLTLILLQRLPKRIRYRTALPLVAISFVFDFMLTDVVAILDFMQIFSRLFILIGTILAYLAYFPPMTVQEKLGIQDYCIDMYTIEELEEKYDWE